MLKARGLSSSISELLGKTCSDSLRQVASTHGPWFMSSHPTFQGLTVAEPPSALPPPVTSERLSTRMVLFLLTLAMFGNKSSLSPHTAMLRSSRAVVLLTLLEGETESPLCTEVDAWLFQSSYLFTFSKVIKYFSIQVSSLQHIEHLHLR